MAKVATNQIMFNCELCQQENNGDDEGMQQNNMEFASLDEFEAHLASEHFNCLPYECEHCQFAKFPTEFAVMRHNEEDHGNRNYSFRCRITPAIKKRRAQIQHFLLAMKNDPKNASITSSADGQQNPSNSGIPASKKPMEIKNEIPDEIAEHQNGIPTTLRGILQQAVCTQKIQQNVQKEGGSISSGNSASGESQTAHGKKAGRRIGGTMEIRKGSELPSNLLTKGGERSAQNEGDEEGDEQFRRQEADVQEILKAAAAAASQVGARNAGLKNSPYSLRPNRFSPYSFLKREQQNWQNQFGLFSLKKGGGVDGGIEGGGSGGLKLQFKNEKVVDRIRCRKCGEMINSTGGCLMHHLNTRHLRLPLFQCRLCKKDFYEVSNTRIHKHMRIHHGGDTSHLVSNYAKYAHTLHAGRDETFGTREERLRAIRGERRAELEKQYSANIGKGKPIQGMPNQSLIAAQNCDTVRALLRNEQGNDEEDTSANVAGIFNKFARNASQDDDISASPANYDENEEFEMDEFMEEEGGEGNEEGREREENGEGEEGEFEVEEQGDVPPLAKEVKCDGGKKSEGMNNLMRNGQQSSNSETNIGASSGAGNSGGPYKIMVGRMQMQLGSEEKVPCRVCGEMVLNKLLNRLNHVNVRHLQLPLHQCRLCNKSFTSYSRSACYSHVQFAHRSDLESGQCSQNIEEHIIYMKEQYSNQLLEAANEYFD